MKKNIVWIVLIVLVALGGVYLLKNETPKDTNQPVGNELTVTYTDSGYHPKQITIKAGTAVKFVNQSQNPMWTASDPHPTHTMMHDFDAMRSMMKGESYSFTFERAGTWRYHNHMVPGHMGSVIVE